MAELQSSSGEVVNWVLAALAEQEYERLQPELEPVSLELGDVLHQAGGAIDCVYFLCSGLVCLLAALGEGKEAEVGLVGKEGLVGLPVVLGGGDALYRAVVQHPGQALRITAAALRSRIEAGRTFQNLLMRYADAFLAQVSQSAVCDCHHPIPRRLCRWLLMAHDRLGTQRLPFTQKALALMLTVRLASVSEAISALREEGVIDCRRGHVTILDRQKLEQACCLCYRIIRDRFERWRSEGRKQAD